MKIRVFAVVIFVAVSAIAIGCRGKSAKRNGTPTPNPTPVSRFRTDLPGVCARIPDGTNTQSRVLTVSRYWSDLNYVRDRVPKSLMNGAAVIYNIKDYTDAIISGLNEKGYCGVWDGHNLYVRKNGENTGEYYQLAKPNGVAVGLPRYQGSSDPAAPFPNPNYPPDWYNQDPECAVPAQDMATADSAVGTKPPDGAQGEYEKDASSSWMKVIQEERAHPTGMIDFTVNSGNINGYLIPTREQNWVFLEKIRFEMRRLGYCSARDDDYIAFKKDSNEYSENFDFIHRKTENDVPRVYIWNHFHSYARPSIF